MRQKSFKLHSKELIHKKIVFLRGIFLMKRKSSYYPSKLKWINFLFFFCYKKNSNVWKTFEEGERKC